MKLRISILIIIAFIVLLSSGCENATSMSPTNPSPVEITEITPFESSPTPDGLSARSTHRVETVIALQTASATPPQTHTPESTSIPNPLQIYLQNHNDFSATKTADIEKFSSIDICGSSSNLPSSPDGDWFVYDCPNLFQLLLIKTDGTTGWQLSYIQFSNSNKSPEQINVSHWSRDNRYVYFIPSYGCCWDPPMVFLGDPIDELWQFDLETGNYINIMYGFDYVSFSPDDKTAVFIPQYNLPPPTLTIYDLETHKSIQYITLSAFPNNPTAGNIVWSPDGKTFVVLTASGGDFEYDPNGAYKDPLYSIVLIDLVTFSQRILISESKKGISLLEITDSNILKFYSYEIAVDGSGFRIDEQYDLTTNQFITPTPKP